MEPISELHARIQTKKVLLGCAICTGAPTNVELAGMLGYDVVWGDLEHGSISPHQAELFCMAAKAGGAIPLLRVQSAERTYILRALDAGAGIISVPMVNDAETARRVVEHGKHRPIGGRGFVGSSRGMRYGVGNNLENMEWTKRETHLFVQIETVEAVRNCAAIASVEGLSGVLVGPGDLSVSMGKPLAFADPEVVKTVGGLIRTIREHNKIAMLVSGHPALVKVTLEAGVQIIVCAQERPALRVQWMQTLKEMDTAIKAANVR